MTLRFRGRPSRIVIPFAAITAFGDPSVNFGLQLKTLTAELADDAEVSDEGDPCRQAGRRAEVIALDTFRKK